MVGPAPSRSMPASAEHRDRRAGRMRHWLTGLAVGWVVVLGVLSCAGGPRPATAPVPEAGPGEVAWTLFLIGDGGDPAPEDPVLAALTRQAGAAPARSTIVFLGDNIYPAGLPDSADPARPEMERRLERQLEVALSAGVRSVMLPGNHDWMKGAAGGWEAVRREGRLVEHATGGLVEYLPGDGCPGPAVRDLGDRLRLVALDTQWWLHGGPRPGEGSACGVDTEPEVTGALREAIDGAGSRAVIVVSHHPYASGAEHGGHFTFRQHVFPMTELASWAWLPLPVVGSLYPGVRKLGVSSQDVTSGRYAAMIGALDSATAGRRPLAWAAGHEHTLQVLEGGAAQYMLVSGTGYYGHSSPVGWLDRTRYASSRSGFIRLDALADGRIRLGVLEVAADGTTREGFSMYLRGAVSGER
jgi:hypothetical protein